MKFLTPLFRAGLLLACCVAGPLDAQQPIRHPPPAAKDLSSPINAAGDDAPVPVPAPRPEVRLLAQFDQNGDHRLDAAERHAARAFLVQHPPPDSILPPSRPGQMPPPPVALEPVKPGTRISPAEVAAFTGKSLYDTGTLRTLFLEFDEADWEKELADFARTDVLVPARLTVDGHAYAGVGVRFRAQTALLPFAKGYKRSLDLALDHTLAGQQLGGQRRLELLDAGTDPTFLRTMLYSRIAREYLPAPRTCFVRVVINGENWGVYVSTQPLDENFIQKTFGTTQSAHWTVSPGGNLAYLGDNPEVYRSSYHLKSPDDPAAWTALIRLCKILNETPRDELPTALAPYLDIDGALKFLALENALINQDGYGSNTGTYGLYLDAGGRFHLIPQDTEASFRLLQVSEYGNRPREGRSGRGGRRGGGHPDSGGVDGKAKLDGSGQPAPRGYNPEDFPHQSTTDLAMMLSYSFISKADSQFNGKVNKDEWLTFAGFWFLVMDEDHTGQLTRDQFIAKFRLFVTPPSIIDGRTQQTFGHEDAAAVIGRDFFAALDENHDDQLTREELTGTFARWFAAWSDPKSARLTQDALERGFTSIFSQSVFQADQSYIARRNHLALGGGEREGRGGGSSGGHGRQGGGGGGSGVNLGPLHLGGGGRGGDSRGIITFSEELDPLAGLDETTKPLLTKLLSVPMWRVHYLDDVRDITENWLTWSKLGPIAKEYHDLIAAEISKDTHKHTSYARFVQELDQEVAQGPREGEEAPSLKSFITERSSYLLKSDALNGANGGW